MYKETVDTQNENVQDIHENIDKMIIDCGTTKTVARKYCMENFLKTTEEERKKKIKYGTEKRFFRFGNSVRYPSKQEISIPIKLGQLESFLHVSVVDANIPLLLGRPDLKKLCLIINFENDTVFTSTLGNIFSRKNK